MKFAHKFKKHVILKEFRVKSYSAHDVVL